MPEADPPLAERGEDGICFWGNNMLLAWFYKHVAKPFFFRQDPEKVHDRMTAVGEFLGRCSISKAITSRLFKYEDSSLEQTIRGIHFSNPIGLAAGFDKNAQLMDILPSVGFGFEEIGSITGELCEGNPKPRLWRLPESKGLVVNYGLKNDGCEAIALRLSNKKFDFPIGTSIAKTNSPATVSVEAGIADYEKAFRAFASIGQYFTINVSCPNAYGGEPFTDPSRLELLLARLDVIRTEKPIFLKLPVDLTTTELDALVAVADRHHVHGIILSNLTKNRTRYEIKSEEIAGISKGGISGKPTFDASNALIEHLYKTTGSRFVIIGCGGIFSARDAYEKIKRGASLVQLITGMIFEGPQLIGEINCGLVRLMKRDGFKNIGEAVGSGVRS
jgi:dihydroorotate dehydrogenase subfamily 2